MNHPRFFGYGSLVNFDTHSYPEPKAAKLQGWRRVWRHTNIRDFAFLSVEPHEGTVLLGATALVPNADFEALDEREFAYARRPVAHQVTPEHDEVVVYEVEEGYFAEPSTAHPVLLSYLDVVVQGYHRLFGDDGVKHFFDTTMGWESLPVLDDRHAPLYPRACLLTDKETALVDAYLKERGQPQG